MPKRTRGASPPAPLQHRHNMIPPADGLRKTMSWLLANDGDWAEKKLYLTIFTEGNSFMRQLWRLEPETLKHTLSWLLCLK